MSTQSPAPPPADLPSAELQSSDPGADAGTALAAPPPAAPGHARFFRGPQPFTHAFSAALVLTSLGALLYTPLRGWLALRPDAPSWQVWRPLSYALIELKSSGLLLAPLLLLALGPILQQRFGRSGVAGLLLLGALIPGVAFSALQHAFGLFSWGVGAGGVVFTCLGAFALSSFRHRAGLPQSQAIATLGVIVVALPWVVELGVTHLLGFFVGAALGLRVEPPAASDS